MRNDREGSLYLGDVVRRIAVADFAKAVYDDDHQLVLVQSDGDEDFDNEDLYMYYNYLNAWDFYADMGWISPDGEGSDVVFDMIDAVFVLAVTQQQVQGVVYERIYLQ